MKRLFAALLCTAAGVLAGWDDAIAQRALTLRTLNAEGLAALRESDSAVTVLSRSGQLSAVSTTVDVLVPGREHERFQQVVNGVPVWATTVTRQHQAGVPVSIFGAVYEGLDGFDTSAALSAAQARTVASTDAGVPIGDVPTPL